MRNNFSSNLLLNCEKSEVELTLFEVHFAKPKCPDACTNYIHADKVPHFVHLYILDHFTRLRDYSNPS